MGCIEEAFSKMCSKLLISLVDFSLPSKTSDFLWVSSSWEDDFAGIQAYSYSTPIVI